MINSDTRIDEALLLRYFEGEVTLSEKDEIEKWIISSEANYKPQNKMFHFCKTFCSKITLVNTIQNVILNPI